MNLTWQHQTSPTFSYFKIYRNLALIGTSVWPVFNDTLPDYGNYRYAVTAFYTDGESAPAIVDVQWGNPQAQVNPASITEYVLPDGTASQTMQLNNVGQLPLNYTAEFMLPGPFNPPSRAYCTGIGGCGEYVQRVEFLNIENISDCNGYEDFTALNPSLLSKGSTFSVTITNGSNMYSDDVCGVWIDWNQDENFTNDGSITVSGSPGIGPYIANITVPDNAKDGTTRMRIRIKRGGTASPCGTLPYGEVEDYSINVLGWVSASPLSGTINAGESQQITFEFDATGLSLGTYEVNYVINSNDPDGQVIVPVTLNVTDVALTATADKYEICYGGSTTLHAQGSGGSGSYTFSWTSDPPGFTSTDPNPVVEPEATTTYTVVLTDGGITLQDQVTITVRALPDVNLGEDVAVCEGGEAVLDAGTGFSSYLWSTGATGSTISVSQPGSYWVEVANQYGCSSRDTVEFSNYPLPVVSLGADKNYCEGTSVMLDAGTGFATYVWSTGDNSYYINASEPGEYWVLVTDANGCTDADTIVLSMDPLPLATTVSNGPISVDNFLNPTSDFSCDASAYATSYEWRTRTR